MNPAVINGLWLYIPGDLSDLKQPAKARPENARRLQNDGLAGPTGTNTPLPKQCRITSMRRISCSSDALGSAVCYNRDTAKPDWLHSQRTWERSVELR